jgi:hypothetical protein
MPSSSLTHSCCWISSAAHAISKPMPWRVFLAKRTEAVFQEWRDDRDHRAEIRAIHARGENLSSEIFSSLMRCVCGVTFDSHKPAESYDHRVHISAVRDARPR